MQEEFLRQTDALQHEYYERWWVLCERAQKVASDRPSNLDMEWLLARRSVMVEIRTMMAARSKAEDRRDLDLLASSQAIKGRYPAELHGGMAWRAHTQEALERAVVLRERGQPQARDLHPQTNAPTASSHVVVGARDRYLQ